MPFRFTCPYCYRKTIVDDRYIGQTGPCVGCGKTITITAPKSSAVVPANVDSGAASVSPLRMPRAGRRWLRPAVFLLAAILLIGAAVWLSASVLVPSLAILQQQHDHTACISNVISIARALNAYAADYGTYPPPVVNDDNGKPLYSWRVLILPYLGEADLYARFDLDQAWDAPANIKLLPACPDVFQCPAARNATSDRAAYMLIVGNGTLFPPSGPGKPDEIPDGADRTLLVVESSNPGVEWTRPVDVRRELINWIPGARGRNTIGGNHADGFAIAFADGTAAWVPADAPRLVIQQIITPDGSEPVNVEMWRIK